MPLGIVVRPIKFERDVEKPGTVRELPSGNHWAFSGRSLKASGWGQLSPHEAVKELDVEFEVDGDQVRNLRRYSPLPVGVRRLLDQHGHGCAHVGLALDKYGYRYGNQELSRGVLEEVVATNARPPKGFLIWRDRHRDALASAGSMFLSCKTTGPLTLHLSRASALENAGICLHPLYGFVYLPGTGIKGMTRSYAQTVAQATEEEVKAVFGDTSDAGSIVFHDAWPTEWPKLIVDILNNHHADYYKKGDPPGDWENPVPVYFLAVERDTTFEFAVAKRRDDVPQVVLEQAGQWLLGALCHLGAGAKTNAGYGAFKPIGRERPSLASPKHVTFEATLELVTPAFLAGANQQAADCDLRSATLRGLLRWWWRTMHAGFVDARTLRQMEAAIWGDTERGGSVRLTVERIAGIDAHPYDKWNVARQNRLAAPASKATSQGLWYQSYGMDERKHRRHFLAPGAQWKASFMCRDWSYEEQRERRWGGRRGSLAARVLMDQLKASLWLLCHFGGVGAKCRKGFGSLADPAALADWSWQRIEETAEAFRRDWRATGIPYAEGRSDSPALSESQHIEIPTRWTNPWFAVDQLGVSRQVFAQASTNTGHGKHCPAKVALGLPRNIHKGPPERLEGPMGDRYASPVLFHFAEAGDGVLQLRVLAFIPTQLWALGYHDNRKGPAIVKQTLQQLLDHLKQDFAVRTERLGSSGQNATSFPGAAGAPARESGTGRVRVKVLAKHSLPNSFRVQEEGERKNPGILQFGKPPSTLPEPGQTIEVYRHNTDPRSPQYRWDPPPPPTQQRRGGPSRGRR